MAYAGSCRQGVLSKRQRALGHRGENAQEVFEEQKGLIWSFPWRVGGWRWFSDLEANSQGWIWEPCFCPIFQYMSQWISWPPGVATILGPGTESSYVTNRSLDFFHTHNGSPEHACHYPERTSQNIYFQIVNEDFSWKEPWNLNLVLPPLFSVLTFCKPLNSPWSAVSFVNGHNITYSIRLLGESSNINYKKLHFSFSLYSTFLWPFTLHMSSYRCLAIQCLSEGPGKSRVIPRKLNPAAE